jgi:hypothetical protein
LLVLILQVISGEEISLARIFSYSELNFSTVFGWGLIAVNIICSVAISFAILLVVERAKLCLDFTNTLYAQHFILVIMYSGFPQSWVWWGVFLACDLITIKISRRLCEEQEMQPIQMNNQVDDELEMQHFV